MIHTNAAKESFTLSKTLPPVVTAGLRPELFPQPARLSSRRTVVLLLALLVACGFGLRVVGLGVEGLSEDELNKLNAVADYRAHGLTSANGEHPMLMKALVTLSVVAADKWNRSSFAAPHAGRLEISEETALRFPSIVFGALTSVLIFLVTAELFGTEVALISAALWAFDPNAVALNRIAKEDTFLLFFFLLANVFWLKSQRIAESRPDRDPNLYYWATAAAFGAMVASKYLPHFIAISVSYYYIFQGIPSVKWRLGKPRFLMFFAVMAVAFVLFNPTILLPDTWKEMSAYASYKLLRHDSYQFMDTLYKQRMTDWLNGVPWYFYYVFMAVKLPLATLAAFLIGFVLLFRNRTGDGRFFILFWMLLWFLPFSVMGGKFTRYVTVILPAVFITAAIGAQFAADRVRRVLIKPSREDVSFVIAGIVYLALASSSLIASLRVAPHYRLQMNSLGGGLSHAGYYFPHDEFYDAAVRDAILEIAKFAPRGTRVASETPGLAAHYSQKAGREDLNCVMLSDPEVQQTLAGGDVILAARGRWYFSNFKLLSTLQADGRPVSVISIGGIPAVYVYVLDQHLVASTGANSSVPGVLSPRAGFSRSEF
jgi:hypothetical protein